MARSARRKAAPAPPVVTLDDAAVLLVQASSADAELMRTAATALAHAAATINARGDSGGPLLGSAAEALRAAAEVGVEARCEEALAEAAMIVEALMSARDDAETAPPPQPPAAARTGRKSRTRKSGNAKAGEATAGAAKSDGANAANAADVDVDVDVDLDAAPLDSPPADAAPVGEAETAAPAAAAGVSALPDWATPEALDAVFGESAQAAEPAASTIPADADPELLDGFVAESLEYLDAAESALLVLENQPDDNEACNTVFRAFHTIKGTAAFLGLGEIADFAHWAESLLGRVRERRIRFAHAVADLSLRSVDMLRSHVQIVRAAALPGAPVALPHGYADLFAQLHAADSDDAIDSPRGDSSAAAASSRAAQLSAGGDSGADGLAGAKQVATADVSAAMRSGNDAWMRVRTERLDRLIDMVGELVIAHAMIAEDETLVSEQRYELARKVGHTGKIVRELQDLSMSMRMLPLRPTFQKITRLVRDLSQRTGKSIELVTVGEETEIDRSMVDLIGDPLVHMVRNAIDHGLEPAADRVAAGKAETGRVRLSAFHAGGSVVIELEDDGRGLDRQRIMARATERGLIEPGKNLSDADLYALIFAPGFSTAETVTELSGRGVGMDVVRRNIEALRGRIEITSRPGEGTRFSIRLPLTLAITDGMLVRVGTERYIVPTVNIQLSFRPDASQLSTIGGRGELVRLRDELMPLMRLHRIFGIDDAQEDPTKALLIVVGSGQRRFAILVDDLLAQQQVVAKPLGQGIGRVDGVSGSAILGDGRVGLILDVPQLAQLSRGAAVTADAA